MTPLPYSAHVSTLTGVVTSGLGQGAFFMSLPWVCEAVRRLAGFTPYPGTLNVRLVPDMIGSWRELRRRGGLVLQPPPDQPCGARLYPVVVAPGIGAAIIVPDLTRYGDDVLEVIAPIELRGRLGLQDGASIGIML
jgi:riboflavin kinase, archaea type